ncbi:hypothetical protein GCM10010129_57780 [Streptomyces fumigatiscleroticus]|nr:hypothetical protein GCM10010129_57780 [Streptomyces fumigatiscleroticus]
MAGTQLLYLVFHIYGLVSLKARLMDSWAVPRQGDRFVRLRPIASVLAVGVALIVTSAQTALAAPPPNPAPPEITVTVPGESPEAVTSCDFYASKPNHSGSRMTGTGGIKTCSGGPVACTSEVDLEFYNEYSRMWMTAGTARQSLCAPPLRSSTAAATCVNHPGDPNVAWRTTTVGTLVSKGGSVGGATPISPVLYVPCV